MKIGSIRSLSTSPAGSLMPQTVPDARYSFQRAAREVAADDALERDDPGLPHEHRAARERFALLGGQIEAGVVDVGRDAGDWGPSDGSNQKALRPVRTRPLSGMPLGRTQSNALMRSVATSKQPVAQVVDVADLAPPLGDRPLRQVRFEQRHRVPIRGKPGESRVRPRSSRGCRQTERARSVHVPVSMRPIRDRQLAEPTDLVGESLLRAECRPQLSLGLGGDILCSIASLMVRTPLAVKSDWPPRMAAAVWTARTTIARVRSAAGQRRTIRGVYISARRPRRRALAASLLDTLIIAAATSGVDTLHRRDDRRELLEEIWKLTASAAR